MESDFFATPCSWPLARKVSMVGANQVGLGLGSFLKISATRPVRGKKKQSGNPDESVFNSSGIRHRWVSGDFARANRRGCHTISFLLLTALPS